MTGLDTVCNVVGSGVWATRRNKHAAILIGGVLVGMSIPLFNMINLLLVSDPLEMAFKYPRPTLPPYMTPIEPQVGKFYNSPEALEQVPGGTLCSYCGFGSKT